MKKCSICDKMVEDDLKLCPYCNHDFEWRTNPTPISKDYLPAPMVHYYNQNEEYASLNNDDNKPHSKFAIIVIILLSILIFGGLIYLIIFSV